MQIDKLWVVTRARPGVNPNDIVFAADPAEYQRQVIGGLDAATEDVAWFSDHESARACALERIAAAESESTASLTRRVIEMAQRADALGPRGIEDLANMAKRL